MLLNAALGFISPGFESGDLGYLSRTDVINYHVGTGYKWNDPTDYYRYINILGSVFGTFDFGGDATCRGVWGGVDYQLPSYDYIGLYYDYGFESFSDFTREAVQKCSILCATNGISIIPLTAGTNMFYGAYWYAYEGQNAFYHNINFSITMRPVSSVSVSFSPGYSFNRVMHNGLDKFDDPLAVTTYGKRYIFADLIYKELSAQLRNKIGYSHQR